MAAPSKRRIAPNQLTNLGPCSQFILRSAALFSTSRPLLDLACGQGRNAIPLANAGFSVIAADIDCDRLSALQRFAALHNMADRVQLVCADFRKARWPFALSCFSAIVCVHFFDPALISQIYGSLIPGGHLCVETFGGQGQNHLALPLRGELAAILSRAQFRAVTYEERPVGPVSSNKCAVKLLAAK